MQKMECKKCHSPATLTLRLKDFYCAMCFVNNVNHKFRACIGKNKILSANEKVLICINDGAGSAVLLDLIYKGINMDNQKKLRIVPYFLYIIDSSVEDKKILQKCSNYKFDLYMCYISEYMNKSSNLCEKNRIPTENRELESEFCTMMQNVPASVKYDLLQKIKRTLFIRSARVLDCKFIFTAETTTTLATNLLTNLTLGRGSQIENDVGFCDRRHDEIKIVRPMREISQEELDNYLEMNKIPYSNTSSIPGNSLQSVIQSFVTDLQGSFQSTVSTVFKTADKIGIHNHESSKRSCVICQSDLKEENTKLTALDAINFSRIVSHKQLEPNMDLLNNENVDTDLFPSLNIHLCYGCSRNYSEMKTNKIPGYIQDMI